MAPLRRKTVLAPYSKLTANVKGEEMDAGVRYTQPRLLFCTAVLWTWSSCLPLNGWQEEPIWFSRLQDPLHQELVQLTSEQIEAIDQLAQELLEFHEQFKGDERAKDAELKRRQNDAHDRSVQLLDEQQRYRNQLATLALMFGPLDALDDMRRYEDDLQLSPEQRAFFASAHRDQARQNFALLEAELGGKLDEDLAKSVLQRDAQSAVGRTLDVVESKLNAEQRNRWRELRWRDAMLMEGIEFFARPDIQELLEFTDAEKSNVSRIMKEAIEAESRLDKLRKTHGEACKEFYRALSPERIARLKELAGPPPPVGTFRERADPLKDL